MYMNAYTDFLLIIIIYMYICSNVFTLKEIETAKVCDMKGFDVDGRF
jgi:hypothetical protein